MPTIGSRKHAAEMLALYYSYLDLGEFWSPDDLDGEWKYLDSGSYRTVYLHQPTGVVYKIEDGYAEEDGYGNRVEHKNAQALRRLAWEHVYIPMTSLFTFPRGPVLAMEFIEGEQGSGSYEGRKELFKKGRFRDMHAANWIERDGKVVPIDMASLRCKHDDPDEWERPDRRVLY